MVCVNQFVILNGLGVVVYLWNNGVINGILFMLLFIVIYMVIGISVVGCQNIDQVMVIVNLLFVVSVGVDKLVCIGGSVMFNGSGVFVYMWNNGVSNGVVFVFVVIMMYIVIGVDVNGCVNIDQVIVIVNLFLNVNVGSDQMVCVGIVVIFFGLGVLFY